MKINIKHIAKLANINISEDEEEKFEKQLSNIINYVEQLNKEDTSQISPTSQVTGLKNVLRDDKEIISSFSQEDALKNAQSTNEGFFEVDAILDDK